jgi:hypothetical protein
MMQNIAEQNLKMWKSMQENFYTRNGTVKEESAEDISDEEQKHNG